MTTTKPNGDAVMSDNKMSGAEVLERMRVQAAQYRNDCLRFTTVECIEQTREDLDVVASMIAHEAAQAKRIAELEAALTLIANQGPHYGPDGTYKTWKHWVTIAKEALAEGRNG